MSHEQAWLQYREATDTGFRRYLTGVLADGDDAVIRAGIEELKLAASKMYGIALPDGEGAGRSGIHLTANAASDLGPEGYHIRPEGDRFVIEGGGSSGIMYGIFQLLRLLQLGVPAEEIDERRAPANALRMLNHWDNMDGTIERGYSGRSFFFADDRILVNDRTRDYARLAASVGINGVVLNNVNVKRAATWLITERYLDDLRRVHDLFAAYGIKLFLSLNFAAPMEMGELETADPLSEDVRAWWRGRLKEVFEKLPGFGGFLVKADSEGRHGPFTYRRTHAEGANMLAEIVEPYGGLILWRCFVYDCQQDWRDRATDRARAGYDHFRPLDGSFRDNVILQIKNGPMDFQVREPVSPLFGGLKSTRQMLEVQIAQEYTGQQKHVCYLIPMFKEVLDFRTYGARDRDTVADLIGGHTPGYRTAGGIAAVANTGDDDNWTGHDLAAANWYGYGRLAFDTDLSAERIAREWIALTFGQDPLVMDTTLDLLMNSWRIYESYTSPLGIGWMVNPNHHYGPNVDGYEYDRWGTYHRADLHGLGVDRSSRGTGYAMQYLEPNASAYDRIETCPEELLLFFHYVRYDHRLSSGKTLIQHIYDTHFEGANEAAAMLIKWKALAGKLEPRLYDRVLSRLEHQARHAGEWRDVVNSYFRRKSGIADEQARTIY